MAKPSAEPTVPRRQIAALPWRIVDGRLEVCLVTTRETRRWTIPKGWPMRNRTDRDAARLEAEQEAGVTGKPTKAPIGTYDYFKRLVDRFELLRVEVYALKATKTLEDWKEKGEREVRWFTAADAALLVDEPELATLITRFTPEAA